MTPYSRSVSHSGVAAVILAAGRSSRMGQSKAALRLPGGQTFLDRIATELAGGGAATVIAVISGDSVRSRAAAAAVRPERMRYVTNPEPDRGQLSSLQCGLTVVSGAPAVLVTLVDVPLVARAVVHAIIEAWASSGAPLVRPTRRGQHGHPMLVGPPLIAELLAASPSSSARDIVRRYASEGVELEMQEDGPFLDVDTPEEYGRLIASLTVDR